MRFSPTAAVFAFVCALFCTGIAAANSRLTIDGAPVAGAVVVADDSSATITNVDQADTNATGSSAASNDPQGKVLLVWVWLLPISGVLCISAYVIVIGQMNRSWAAAAVRRGKPVKNVSLLV